MFNDKEIRKNTKKNYKVVATLLHLAKMRQKSIRAKEHKAKGKGHKA
jgi:hypothetical protein